MPSLRNHNLATTICLHLVNAALLTRAFQLEQRSAENVSVLVEPAAQSEDFVLRSFIITCCEDGQPVPDDDIADAVKEWVIEQVDDERTCKSYTGYYNVSLAQLRPREKFGEFGVKCKCPEGMESFDRNCRFLPECLNGGYRSFSIELRCVCPKPFFGTLCDKFCANGILLKQKRNDDEDVEHCQCRQNFYGEECDHIVCFNHGTPVKGRGCLCRFPFVGMHCETELSHLVDFPTDSRIKWYSYLFGTCSSVILIILISMAVYCIFRRRRLSRSTMVNVGTNVSNGHLGPYESDYAGGHVYWTDDCGRIVDLSRLPPPPAYQDALVVIGQSPPAAHIESESRGAADRQQGESTIENNPDESPRPIRDASSELQKVGPVLKPKEEG